MPDTQTLEISEIIEAPINQVFQSFSSSVALENWFSDFAEIMPSENGRFYVFWNAGYYADGLVKKVENEKLLHLTWRGQGESKETDVEIKFYEEDGNTGVTIVHSELGTSGHWEGSSQAIKSGWEYALNNLKSVLETGLDKRIYDRPLLGIYPNQPVDDEMVKKHNLPITTGIQIGGVIEGFGAESAGLQADDVIFSLNGYELKSFDDFSKAIGDVKAGESVKVVFYRGEQERIVDMELSSKPSPDVPDSVVGLAKLVNESYQEFNSEIDKIFDGVTEGDAAFRPGQNDWSAKDTLVHLLYTERWLHLAISCVVSDQRPGGFFNQLELIRAMSDSYSLEDLITELKKSEQITVDSIAALPKDFVADRRKYFGFLSTFGKGFAHHSHSHLPQIKAGIKAARKA
jgi:uncharacterized protein YndB with AHSA1/START domain